MTDPRRRKPMSGRRSWYVASHGYLHALSGETPRRARSPFRLVSSEDRLGGGWPFLNTCLTARPPFIPALPGVDVATDSRPPRVVLAGRAGDPRVRRGRGHLRHDRGAPRRPAPDGEPAHARLVVVAARRDARTAGGASPARRGARPASCVPRRGRGPPGPLARRRRAGGSPRGGRGHLPARLGRDRPRG